MSNLQQTNLILNYPKLRYNIISLAIITCDIMSEYITCVHVLQDGSTPLHLAARYGQSEVVKILADGGATVNATNNVS